MTRADMMADYAFIVQQDGQVESFNIVPPTISTTRGTASGTITVANTTSTSPVISLASGSTAVGVTGGTGTLKKGDLIKFSNHNKVYMITEDVNLDGTLGNLGDVVGLGLNNVIPGLTTPPLIFTTINGGLDSV